MKLIKTISVFAVALFLTIALTGCNKNEKKDDTLNIIGVNFPCYDFARAVVGDTKKANIKMLLKPASESHNFEPTPQDIINIKKSDIFIYTGGESDEWVEDILDDIDKNKTKVIRLMDVVKVVEEETVEGMETEEEEETDEKEYDEHVWTNPINAIKIVNKIKEEVIKIDSKNEEKYKLNSKEYIDELNTIDRKFKSIVANGKRKEIIFGDRFPLRYFVDQYNLSYYAAFPGCSDSTEASAKTISFLIKKVKEDKIPVVFHIELSNGKIANTIAKETNAKVLEFNAAHNISKKDFDAGVTYVDIMNKNIKVLEEALN